MSALYAKGASSAQTSGIEQADLEVVRGLLGDRYVCISTKVLNSLGDLACAEKFAREFFQGYLGLSANQILIETIHKQEFQEVFDPNRTYQVVTLADLETGKFKGKIGLFLVAPWTENNRYSVVRFGVPTLCINECGYSTKLSNIQAELFGGYTEQRALGLGDEDVGLLFDSRLRSWAETTDSQDPLKKIHKLASIDPKLAKAILGEELSEEAFVDSSHLFLGFCHHPDTGTSFITALCMMKKYREKNLCVVLPVNNLELSEIQQGVIKKAGISEVIFRRYTSSDQRVETLRTLTFDQPQPKRLTIIMGRMTNETLGLIRMAAEKETLATGDQSMIDAISAHQIPIYEELHHKEAFARTLETYYPGSALHQWWESEHTQMHYILAKARDPNSASRLRNERDAAPKLLQLVKGLLKRASSPTPPYSYLDTPLDEFDPTKLPLNKWCVFSAEQTIKISIKHDGYSDHEDLKGSKFETEFADYWGGGAAYFVKRLSAPHC